MISSQIALQISIQNPPEKLPGVFWPNKFKNFVRELYKKNHPRISLENLSEIASEKKRLSPEISSRISVTNLQNC